jgi:hypothetical protein
VENLGLAKNEGKICVGLLMRKWKRENIEKQDVKIHTQQTLDENVLSAERQELFWFRFTLNLLCILNPIAML